MRRAAYRLLVGLAAILAAAAPTGAQQKLTRADSLPSTSSTAKLLQADFAVPEAPALKMLDLEDSKLLRPATVKALSAQLSSATGDATFIPRAFAVEFSPGLLLNGEHLSIRDYTRNKYLYRTRVSAASKRGEGEHARTQIAFALRLGLQDNSDLRTNKAYVNALLDLTDWQADSGFLYKEAQTKLKHPISIADTVPDSLKASVDSVVSAELTSRAKKDEALKRIAEAAKWNADVFDVAVGTVASSADSAGKGPRYDGVAGWLTKGLGIPAARAAPVRHPRRLRARRHGYRRHQSAGDGRRRHPALPRQQPVQAAARRAGHRARQEQAEVDGQRRR